MLWACLAPKNPGVLKRCSQTAFSSSFLKIFVFISRTAEQKCGLFSHKMALDMANGMQCKWPETSPPSTEAWAAKHGLLSDQKQ
jgi:hypothetical protein